MENSDYKTIKKHPMHNRITHINIKILQENNINFRQSSNIFRFRQSALKGVKNVGKDTLGGVPITESIENRFNQTLDELSQKANVKTGQGYLGIGSDINTPLNNMKRKIINNLSKKAKPKQKQKQKKQKKVKFDIFQ
jgi:hypothetical protein